MSASRPEHYSTSSLVLQSCVLGPVLLEELVSLDDRYRGSQQGVLGSRCLGDLPEALFNFGLDKNEYTFKMNTL